MEEGATKTEFSREDADVADQSGLLALIRLLLG